jgi:hypothetical protein
MLHNYIRGENKIYQLNKSIRMKMAKKTYIKFEPGVEIIVGDHVHLAHHRVHVPLVRHNPNKNTS